MINKDLTKQIDSSKLKNKNKHFMLQKENEIYINSYDAVTMNPDYLYDYYHNLHNLQTYDDKTKTKKTNYLD